MLFPSSNLNQIRGPVISILSSDLLLYLILQGKSNRLFVLLEIKSVGQFAGVAITH